MAATLHLPLHHRRPRPQPPTGRRMGVPRPHGVDRHQDAVVRHRVRRLHQRGDLVDRHLLLLREGIRQDRIGRSDRHLLRQVAREEHARVVLWIDD